MEAHLSEFESAVVMVLNSSSLALKDTRVLTEFTSTQGRAVCSQRAQVLAETAARSEVEAYLSEFESAVVMVSTSSSLASKDMRVLAYIQAQTRKSARILAVNAGT